MINKNIRTYTVVIDVDSEIPGLESVAVRVDAQNREAAENYGWRWAKEYGFNVQDIHVYLK